MWTARDVVPGVRCYVGSSTGPRVLISVLMHGNERAGWAAYHEARRILQPRTHRGSVTLLVGNPAAVLKRERFIDVDLNRAFRAEHLTEGSVQNCEIDRFRVIEKYFRGIDVLVDIHTTSTPCDPFALCLDGDTRHIEFMQQLSVVKYVTINWRPWLGESTMAWALRWNPEAIAITVECGQHAAEGSRLIAAASARHALIAAGTISCPPKSAPRRARVLEIIDCAMTAEPALFSYAQEFECFGVVWGGQVIASEGRNRVFRAPPGENLRIVLPTAREAVRARWSRDVFYIGREINKGVKGMLVAVTDACEKIAIISGHAGGDLRLAEELEEILRGEARSPTRALIGGWRTRKNQKIHMSYVEGLTSYVNTAFHCKMKSSTFVTASIEEFAQAIGMSPVELEKAFAAVPHPLELELFDTNKPGGLFRKLKGVYLEYRPALGYEGLVVQSAIHFDRCYSNVVAYERYSPIEGEEYCEHRGIAVLAGDLLYLHAQDLDSPRRELVMHYLSLNDQRRCDRMSGLFVGVSFVVGHGRFPAATSVMLVRQAPADGESNLETFRRLKGTCRVFDEQTFFSNGSEIRRDELDNNGHQNNTGLRSLVPPMFRDQIGGAHAFFKQKGP
jgi:predicted deacylase